MSNAEPRVAVVTGAASGIGLALSRRFVDEGMAVVMADVERSALEAAVSSLPRAADVTSQLTDVSDGASVAELASTSMQVYGRVDVLCNNAGVAAQTGAVWEADERDWQWVLGVNFWGVVHGVRAFLPLMLEQASGHVVNTASMAGLVTGGGVYGASKHAVVSLTESLYADLQARDPRIGVSLLCPGFVQTRILEAERNRPAELRHEPAPPAGASPQAAQLEAGLNPDVVAAHVWHAIEHRQFYVLTDSDWDHAIQARMSRILERGAPADRR